MPGGRLPALGASLVAGIGLAWLRRRPSRSSPATAEAHFGLVREHANDAILLIRREGRVVDANRRAETLYGYGRAELLGRDIRDLRPAAIMGETEEILARTAATGSQVFETLHQRKDGSIFPVEVSSRVVEVEGEPHFLSIVRDVSERKQHEARIAHLNRLLRTILEINQLIVRERDRDRLFAEACRVVVEHGGFHMAWVGAVDRASAQVVPVAWAGAEAGYLAAIRVRADESPLGSGPTGLAARTGRLVVVNDWASDERVAPWREEASRRGYRSSAGVPLPVRGRVEFVLTVYASEAAAFGPEAVSLLGGLGSDVGFALETIDNEARRAGAEAALRASEQRYRDLVDSVRDVVISMSPDGTLTSLSSAFEAVTGWKPEEFLGRSFVELIDPADAERALEIFGRFLAGEQVGLFELRVRRRDGGVVMGEFTANPRFEQGRLAEFHGIGRDVTERKRAEAQLMRLAAAVEQAAEAIVITDPEGRIQYVNPAFVRATGYDAGEALGANPRILKSGRHDAAFYREMWATLLRGETWEGRLTNRRKDGQLYEEVAVISPVRDPDGRIMNFVAVKRDVTQEVALEAQLRQAQKMEAVGMLAGGVAHDFNNLLQAMLSHVQLLRSGSTAGARPEASLAELEEQVRRGAALTRQLLLFARRETARPEPLDLNRVIAGAASLLRRLVRENVAFTVELAPGPLPLVADHGQLEQVLVNLVVNAVDAMPGGGRVAIHSGSEGADRVWFSVDDTGHGIPAEIRDKVFEPFFTTKAKGHGTGLGLPVVHGIVTAHAGSVEFRDRPGGGTSFRVTLPMGSTEPAAAVPAAGVPAVREGGGEAVLVVEDEEGARQGLSEILHMLGYRATAVADGEQAGRLPAEPAFGVLIADVMLPGSSGPELSRALRERWPGLRVILISGYAEDEAIRQAAGPGRYHFLQKPFDVETLARELRAALEEDAGERRT
ncbi:MAG TPA: PAS domain S-box protein [Thermoanaerobaculaceae bacterium]|nr:PAS domain S-box protein [Thermoanaerobaculaceae bacterium]